MHLIVATYMAYQVGVYLERSSNSRLSYRTDHIGFLGFLDSFHDVVS